jgi:hypothetical protein
MPLFSKKVTATETDLIALSSDNHKMNALFYDRIFPLHSVKKVPSRYQIDIYLSKIAELDGFNEWLPKFCRFIDGVQKSPRDAITLNGGFLLGRHGLFDETGAYYNIFLDVDNDPDYLSKGFEWPIMWLRDAATLLLFEILTIYGYANVVPIFTSRNIVPQFARYGGIILKPSDMKVKNNRIEVIQENFFQILENETEWSQIREIQRDTKSHQDIKRINTILSIEYRMKDAGYVSDQIDQTLYDFESACKKHGVQYARATYYIYLDIATAASMSLFSAVSLINGGSLPLTVSAIIGTVFSSSSSPLQKPVF